MKSSDTFKLCDLKQSACIFFWVTPEQLVLATEGSLQMVFQAPKKGTRTLLEVRLGIIMDPLKTDAVMERVILTQINAQLLWLTRL